jgi:eukaryotic-like serine/threonine-protein kinase
MDLRDQLQRTLGDAYTLERELGGGGMSHVFVAQETNLGRAVVVKVLLPELAAGVSVDRFRREIQLAAKLQHACIVPLLSAGVSEGLPFYTMPFVEGESLRARLARDHELPINEVVRVLRDIAGALSYAHEHGIVHRDIKPDNVLLTRHHALVTDFGVAKAVSEATNPGTGLTSLGVALGTPAYMSPEQAAADPDVDHRADIYALGVVAYEMLAGQPLFAARSPQAMLAAHAAETPVPIMTRRPAIPHGLAQLVMRCLEKHAADRPQSAEQVVQSLDALATPSGGMAPLGSSIEHETAPARSPGVVEKSIVVLPFANLSADAESEYFSDGMTEEIINALAHLPGVHVAARTSSFAFKGKQIDIADIGAKLKVAHVLEGSVRRAGKRLRITAQLITVADGFQLWSERYDRDLEDVFAIQDEIARAIAEQLKVQLAAPSEQSPVRQGTSNIEAYDLYLKGRYFWARRGQGLRTAVDYFNRAIAADPRFAAPYAGLADCDAALALYGYVPPIEVCERARSAAYRALALDDRSAESHSAVGLFELWLGWDLEVAERELRRAHQLNPSWAVPLAYLSLLLVYVGRREEAHAFRHQACQLDPLSPLINAVASLGACMGRSFDEARVAAERSVELDSSFPAAHWAHGWVCQHEGRFDDAIAALERSVSLSGGSPLLLTSLGIACAQAGHRDRALAIIEELERQERSESRAGFVHWVLGNEQRAFELYEQALRDRVASCFAFGFPPGMEGLGRDPRWHALLRRAGLEAVARAYEAGH